jgi:hypothetical protein
MNERAKAMHTSPIRSSYLVVDDFMPSDIAREMRAVAEAHFGSPYDQSPKTHMNWNYWHVSGLYTYLRTLPEKVIGPVLTEAFHAHLSEWSRETLGLGMATSPYLSLYVNGCRQGQHNDSANGRFGFVYSLTRNVRKTTGGETLIWREDDYFQTNIQMPCSGSAFFESIEPRFNRLLVFDDRVPHAVEIVEGNMDPLEGRLVLHGHIWESGPIVHGPLSRAIVGEIANQLAAQYSSSLENTVSIYHGPSAIRFTVQRDGSVASAHLILDRVKRLRGEAPEVQEMLGNLINQILQLRFPSTDAESIVTVPFAFG